MTCLKQSFRIHGGPVLYLTTTCFAIGAIFLGVETSMGAAFIVAGIVALVVFALLAAQEFRHRWS